MVQSKFLTAEEVCERYRGEISIGTLRNWRALRVGPPFVKIGKSVLYPVQDLDEWDKKNLVICRASRTLNMAENEGE
jgi:hypothetical protein